jgi:iron complex outermembrane recepter protein
LDVGSVRLQLAGWVAASAVLLAAVASAQQAPPSTGTQLPTVIVSPPTAPAKAASPSAPAPKAAAAPVRVTPVPKQAVQRVSPPAVLTEVTGIDSAATGVRMTPLPGSEIDPAIVPGHVSVVSSGDLQRYGAPTVSGALQASVPGIVLNDTLGNGMAQDVQFRGFSASPLNGTPQGLAIYQNGVRINEVFGDAVSWDLVPGVAIRDIAVTSNNPAFGLNALGGAISIAMKDGFSYQGFEADGRIGSFGRRLGSVQGGQRTGAFASYVAADALEEKGWRDLSAAKSRRLYADIGAKDETTEIHLNLSAARTLMGVTGPAPVELLAQRREAVFTTPQTFDNRSMLAALNGSVAVNDALKLSGQVYWRGFRQKRPDGNISNLRPCDPGGANAGLLCVTDGGGEATVQDQAGNDIADSVLGGGLAGSNDSTAVKADSIGGAVQGVLKGKVLELHNQLTLGASLDEGRARVRSQSELGLLDPNTLSVQGLGITLGGDNFSPVGARVRTLYTGVHFSNTLDVTDRLALTVGGRFNLAQIELKDEIGTDLNGSHRFSRFNPMAGAAFKVLPGLSVYAGYSEANRAPTPAELSCADPARPCLLESFLVSDPPLKQVVSHTSEAGVRGAIPLAGPPGTLAGAGPRVEWSLGVFRTLNTDDILSVASQTQGRGYFLNAGETLRQGVEAMVAYKSQPLSVYASYALIDATFRDALALSSPNNPAADADGVVHVRAGDRMPTIPRHRFKAGFDVGLTSAWRIGADLVAASNQFFRGDEGNDVKPLPGYTVVNLKTSYDVTRNFQIYGIVENVFDARYATFGTFYDTVPLSAARGFSDPRTITPAAPLGASVGGRIRF